MKDLLQLQKFSTACSGEECAVEAGRMLGAEFMIYGSIGRIGATCTINVYIASVETGSLIAGATADYQGEIEGLLTQGVPQAMNGLLHAVEKKGKTVQM